jgi:hypothetical protein
METAGMDYIIGGPSPPKHEQRRFRGGGGIP